ncbi:MAG: hypothetical protein DDG60_01600 [Anaerolineae bacterium]|nr:MAG: hypothetical protein DDG60_01600 [Anaerolineae bacterium]
MKRKHSLVFVVSLLLAVFMLLAGCQPAPAASPRPSQEGEGVMASTVTLTPPPPTATKPAKPTRKPSATPTEVPPTPAEPKSVHEKHIQGVGPVTDSILMLHFRDGEYRYNKRNPASLIWRDMLDTNLARLTDTYTITSPDDSDYADGQAPLRAGIKSKPTGFEGMYLSKYISDHWVFLELPFPMKRGKTYTVVMNRLGPPQTIVFDEFQQFSEAIKVNQIGYSPRARVKYAYITLYMGENGPLELESLAGTACHVVKDDGSNEIVFSNTIAKRKDLETGGTDFYPGNEAAQQMWFPKFKYPSYTGADVWECDFGNFRGVPGYTGKYKIVVERMGSSFPFRIDTDTYYEAWRDVMHGLYIQRADIPRVMPYTEWEVPVPYWPVGTVYYETSEQAYETGIVKPETGVTNDKIFGGYYDAADYDRWWQHMWVNLRLTLAYELRPEIYVDGELSIPENNNGVPDILDEAAWNIAFFMRLQNASSSGGGVPAGVWPIPGHEARPSKWFYGPGSSIASWQFSASANWLAYCMDLAGIKRITGPYFQDVELTPQNLRAAAKRAHDWAEANPEKWEGDDGKWQQDKTIRAFSLAWMYRTTGDKTYEEQFKALVPIKNPTDHLFPETGDGSLGSEPGFEGDWQWPVIVYVLAKNENIDVEYQNLLKQAFLHWARYDRIEPTEYRPFRQGWHRRMPPVIGNHSSPDVIIQAVAYFGLKDSPEYLDTIFTSNDYALGGNELNMCMISGCGYRHPTQMLHDYQWYLEHPKGLPKGMVPYGAVWFYALTPVNEVTNAGFAVNMVYPKYYNWGLYELFFDNRFCAPSNEFTVNQTNGLAAFAYAIVKDGGPAVP